MEDFEKTYSFVIPHRNSQDVLRRCIQSIPQRKDTEIIVVDDNSDIKPHVDREDVKVIFIDAEHSKGAGRARNVGLAAARGKWILFADCDDFYEEGFMDELEHYEQSSFDIIIFDAYWHLNLETGKCIMPDTYKKILQAYLDDRDNVQKLKHVKHGRNVCWNKMFSHAFLKRIKAHFEECPTGNDVWFTQYSASKTDNIEVLNKKLYYYIYSPKGISHSKCPYSVILESIKTGGKRNRFLADCGAWMCIGMPWRSVRWNYEKYGLLTVIKIVYNRIKYGIPLHKLIYHKYIKRG